MNTVIHDKNILRRQLRQARLQLRGTQRRRASERICRQLKPLLRRGKRVALYWAVGSELSLHTLFAVAQHRACALYLPYIEAGSRRLWFTPHAAHTRERHGSRQGPAIPQFAGRKIRAHQLHTLVLPMVGIDRRGYRLGQGGGYYDTTLAHTRHRLRPYTVAAGFACQQVEQLDTEAHDMPADAFVCEHGWQHFGTTGHRQAAPIRVMVHTAHSEI